jgi:hypothetical protein
MGFRAGGALYLSKCLLFAFLQTARNSLTGTIPNKIGELSNLKHLLLKSNQLTGTLPAEIDHLTNLDILLLEENAFAGDADAICKNQGFSLQYFAADCSSGINCSCCDICCDGADAACNAGDWDINLDPIWEYGFKRGRYSYDMGSHIVIVP